jgi:hypothetical protein
MCFNVRVVRECLSAIKRLAKRMPGMQSAVRLMKDAAKRARFENWKGFCPICENSVRFYVMGPWWRDQLVCGSCGSVPRERALMSVITTLYPDWRALRIHESSPAARGVSIKFKGECAGYVASQYDTRCPFGRVHSVYGYRSEDLESQTFNNGMFDLVITQDVFEHLFHPDNAIREIARTLRPSGSYIMTVPIVNKALPSKRRASIVDKTVIHHLEPQYHANPIASEGSLVTIDWGYDIVNYLSNISGLATSLFYIDDMSRGIRADYIEVIVCRKPSLLSDGVGPGSGSAL